MTKTPPEDFSHLPYDVMRDKDGNVVYTSYGHPKSARLTKEQETQIEELVSEGKTNPEIARLLRTTTARVSTHLNKPKVADRIAYLVITRSLMARVDRLEETLCGMVEIIQKLESRVSDIQSTQKTIQIAVRRQKIGRAHVEREKRSQRQELNELKRTLWKKTGIKR